MDIETSIREIRSQLSALDARACLGDSLAALEAASLREHLENLIGRSRANQDLTDHEVHAIHEEHAK